jgi:hypothetical protein
MKCRQGKAGDILWVRETWAPGLSNAEPYAYKATAKWDDFEDGTPDSFKEIKWRPSIHMPRHACRLKLKILSIRVERLHDITPDDADREGVESWNEDYTSEEGALHADYANYLWVNKKGHPEYHFPSFPNPIDSFRSLWIKINGQESWDSNPWVWRIEFEKL